MSEPVTNDHGGGFVPEAAFVVFIAPDGRWVATTDGVASSRPATLNDLWRGSVEVARDVELQMQAGAVVATTQQSAQVVPRTKSHPCGSMTKEA